MITSNNLEQYITNAKFKKNKGAMPKLGPNQWVITKFQDGCYGFEKHAENYYWGYGTAYPIMEYAVVDLIPDPVRFIWPSFNDASKILPDMPVDFDGVGHISADVLVYMTDEEFCVAHATQMKDCEHRWFTSCSEGWEITSSVVAWLPLPEKISIK